MQLITSPASPFVRKVRVLIHEAGLSDQIEEVPVVTTPMESAPEAVAANPLGKIPALIRTEGPAIYDSRVICRYLDATFDCGLYPQHGLWEALTLEATAEGILDAAVLMVYEIRFRGEAAWAPWIDAQWNKIDRALDALEARWMAHLSGRLQMGQIATGCALGYLDYRHPDRDWRGTRPALATWFDDGFADRPSMLATVPQ